MKITILGAGAYALALAHIINTNNHEVTVWSKIKDEVEEIKKTRKSNKLPDYIVPNSIKISNNLEKSVENCDLIVIAIPSTFFSSTIKELQPFYKNQPICIATKGIEQSSCEFMSNIVKNILNTNNIAVISGPSFARDIINNIPSALSLAFENNLEDLIKNAFENKFTKLNTSNDIIGIEICGAIKNVFALGAGMIEGMNLPISTLSFYITEVLNSTKELIIKLGGKEETILTYAGCGDIILSCTSNKSRNFSLGKMIGENKSTNEINEFIKNNTIEGLYTIESIKKILDIRNIKLPLIDKIYEIINTKSNPDELVKFLTVGK
jgi:glycerol-3-phosphate dehydrogenase (NAD(P)+)